MIRNKSTRTLIFALILFFSIGINSAFCAGLSTGFGEVILENLEIGKDYSTTETANLPLIVVNTGDEPVDLLIELLMPQKEELKEGFAPIPDLSWIKLEKTEFKDIQPKESAITDVLISIPNNEEYQGKKYQVYIWSHTTGTRVGAGLKSRLLLSINQ